MKPYDYKEVERPRAIAVLIHGFNLNLKKMNDFIAFFHDLKISTINVTLTGHDGSGKYLHEASPQQWKEDSWTSIQLGLHESKKNKIPLFFLGYSTGALIANLLMVEKNFQFEKQFLFAPALSMRSYISLGKFLRNKKVPHSIFPQMNYKNYRATTYVPANFYEAFFGIYEQWLKVESTQSLESIDIPTFIYTRKFDELISLSGLRQIIKQHQFYKWEFHEMPRAKKCPMQHLVIDQESLEQQWTTVIAKMRSHLEVSLSSKEKLQNNTKAS